MLLTDYQPQSRLVTKTTAVHKPRWPVIDAHNHLTGAFGGGWDEKPLAALLDRLDEVDVRLYVDLDGGWGEEILQRHLDHFKEPAPERFRIFGGVDWAQWPAQGARFGEWAAQRLRVQAGWGAEGLKIWKPLGLHVQDDSGARAAVDDPRLDPALGHRRRVGAACPHPYRRPGRLLRPGGRRQRALGRAARPSGLAVPQPAIPALSCRSWMSSPTW